MFVANLREEKYKFIYLYSYSQVQYLHQGLQSRWEESQDVSTRNNLSIGVGGGFLLYTVDLFCLNKQAVFQPSDSFHRALKISLNTQFCYFFLKKKGEKMHLKSVTPVENIKKRNQQLKIFCTGNHIQYKHHRWENRNQSR